jgi:hypothetical protein
MRLKIQGMLFLNFTHRHLRTANQARSRDSCRNALRMFASDKADHETITLASELTGNWKTLSHVVLLISSSLFSHPQISHELQNGLLNLNSADE